MIPKPIDQITYKELQGLINNEVLEGKTIEYKQELNLNKDSDKKEFLADVSSFANASGGDLIFGIVEDRDTGSPKSLEGLLIQNEDELIRKLEAQIRDGIEPRIPSVNIRAIPLNNNKSALIIRILKSWVSPHRVTSGGHDKFYSRNSKGKYPLDVGELRIAFNMSSGITEQIRKFRENRISEIYTNESYVPLFYNAKIVLHLIPLSSIISGKTYDMSKLPFDPRLMQPFYSDSWNHRYNLDGFLTYSRIVGGVSSSYVQLFRNGIFEAVNSTLLKQSNLKIPNPGFEESVINEFKNCIYNLKDLDVGLPIFAFLTLIDVKGYWMDSDPIGVREEVIEKDVLLIPEIVIENFDFKVENILNPWFNAVWNACGFPRSMNYNSNGERIR